MSIYPSLSFSFTALKPFSVEQRTYDPELEDVRTILWDVCSAMQEQEAAKFEVSGFGEKWWVDLSFDFLVFVEQVPNAMKKLANSERFSLDFYEQGTERFLSFTPGGAMCIAKCLGPPEHQPPVKHELVVSSALATMLGHVMNEFEGLLIRSSPAIAEHPWIRTWLTGSIEL